MYNFYSIKAGLIVFQFVTNVAGFTNTLTDYFPEINNDLTRVTWIHAVNSKERLKAALEGNAMMLEADILMGHTSEKARDEHKPFHPIMAHPPQTVSDLTLEEFINTVVESKARKGIKLDFKTRDAFSYSETIIDTLFYNYHTDFPVWLNADIIPGPVNASREVVDPDYFLSACISRYPSATISVGWSTKLEKGSTEGYYSQNDINRMTESLNNNMVLVGPVTFAVRAAFAARSVDILTALIKSSTPEATTLTIWSSDENDVVDVEGIKKLIKNVGKHSVYLDVPEEMYGRIVSEYSSASSIMIHPKAALITVLSLLLFAFL